MGVKDCVGVAVKVEVGVSVGVAVLVYVNVGVGVRVGVTVNVGVKVFVEPISGTNAQSTWPVESCTQLSLPTMVGVFVGVATEHGGKPVLGSIVPVVFFHSISSAPALYKAKWL